MRWQTAVGYLLPVAWIVVLLALYDVLHPVARLLGATALLLLAVKVGAWVLLRGRSGRFSLSPFQFVLFWTVWPAVRPDRFADADEKRPPKASEFAVGYVSIVAGILLGVATLFLAPVVGMTLGSWLLIAAFFLVIHFGIGLVLPFALRWVGIPVPSLFDRPLRSRGVGEFWARRWNLPFVQMNRLFVTHPLRLRLGVGGAAFVAFVVSGILHELAISYAAGGGWGLPFLYFMIQAALYTIEAKTFPDEGWELARRVWTWAAVLVPLPLLFHGPFRQTFLVPFIDVGRSAMLSYSVTEYLALALWVGAAGHFLVLVASSQVPRELEWREELQQLQPLNRKLMWTYGGFIVLVIVSFGVLTILFHGEFIDGNPVALGLSGMIAAFWTARVLVDIFYFDHDDWPEGVEYIVGHVLLTSLFAFLVVAYGGTVAFHVL